MRAVAIPVQVIRLFNMSDFILRAGVQTVSLRRAGRKALPLAVSCMRTSAEVDKASNQTLSSPVLSGLVGLAASASILLTCGGAVAVSGGGGAHMSHLQASQPSPCNRCSFCLSYHHSIPYISTDELRHEMFANKTIFSRCLTESEALKCDGCGLQVSETTLISKASSDQASSLVCCLLM